MNKKDKVIVQIIKQDLLDNNEINFDKAKELVTRWVKLTKENETYVRLVLIEEKIDSINKRLDNLLKELA